MEGKGEFSKDVDFQNAAVDRKKFPYNEITRDGAKWLLTISKIGMETLCVWAHRQNKATACVNIFLLSSYAILIVAQLAYILDKDTDIDMATDAITGVVSSFEAGGRRLLGVLLAKRIGNILSIIYYDFWPSDIAGKEMHKHLNIGSWILIISVGFEAFTAFSWGFQCALIPLSHHRLSLSSKFWFPFKESPYFEFLYIWESLMSIDLAANIGAFDSFLLILIWQCVAQFKLLRKFVQVKFEEVVKRSKGGSIQERSEATKLLLVILRRHNSLIKTCKELESMLTVFVLMLYIGTIGTICLSSFLVTVVKSQIGKALPYFVGHLVQIFQYCFLGNEIILESMALAEEVARCGWHLLPYDRNLQKSIVLIMVRSQRPITITVGGFGILSINSFMKLLQFCFSVYTLLSKMVSRNEK